MNPNMKPLTSLEHPLVKYWAKLKSSASFRKEHNRILIEGIKLIQDVAKTHKILRLISTNAQCDIQADESFFISQPILNKLTSVETSDGILAEIELPHMAPLTTFTKIVVLDRIQDPGNLGTIIRSALSLGWEGVYLLPGCCDPYNDKALRSAKAATFNLPLYSGSWEELAAACKKNGAEIVVSDMNGEDVKTAHFAKIALVLGNEGQGVSISKDVAHSKVKIPMHGSFDSLNVAIAGAILMYTLS